MRDFARLIAGVAVDSEVVSFDDSSDEAVATASLSAPSSGSLSRCARAFAREAPERPRPDRRLRRG